MLFSVISFLAFFLLVSGFTTKVTSQTFPGGLPVGPDIVIKELDLTEDLDLSIILSNAGQTDLGRGVGLGIQVFVNKRKISEFDHYVSGSLKANFGNRYVVNPPSRIGISGICRVKISISPKRASDDIQPGNNMMERTFVVFPLKMGPREKQSYSVSPLSPGSKDSDKVQKMKLEARVDGEARVVLSVSGPGDSGSGPTFSGKTPLKAEVPLHLEDAQKDGEWRISVTNRLKKKLEGHLLIQYP